MTIIVYKCDTCKREIELQQNKAGLETINRCTITHGCRGKLYQTKVFPDYARGRVPDAVEGLDDWQQRRLLYNHQQPISESTWEITHNLGIYPSVFVFVSKPLEDDADNLEEITPTDIIVVDTNTIELVFDREWSGMAQLVVRESDPLLLNPLVREAQPVVVPFQFTNLGEITVATRLPEGDAPEIDIQIEYTSTINEKTIIVYAADDSPALTSAWSDYDKVIIREKTYVVRSFNMLVPEMTVGTIDNGSVFRFINVDPEQDTTFRPIVESEVLILLANEPYSAFDKIENRFIDVTSVTDTVNQFSLSYTNGECLASPDIIENTYPPIRAV